MAGPFDFITGLLGGGQGEVGQGSDPLAPRSAFERVFNPNQPGTLAGFVGNVFGVPSVEERRGGANAVAMAELSKLREQGLDPSRAIMTFIQSPKGQQWMSSGVSDVEGTLKKFVDLTLPAQPQVDTTPPGHMRTERNRVTGEQTQQTVPTPHQQDFQAHSQAANLDQEALRELNYVQSLPPEMRQTRMQERAIQKLVKTGAVTEEMGQKLISGALKVQEGTNAYGEKTGTFYMIDMSTGSIIELKRPGQGQPRAGANPPGTSVTPGATGTYTPEVPGVQTTQRTPSVAQAPQMQGGTFESLPGTPVQTQTFRSATPPAPSAEPQPLPPSGIPSLIGPDARRPDGSVDWSRADPKARMFLGVGVSPTLTSAVGRGLEVIDPALRPEAAAQVQRDSAAFRNFQQSIQNLVERGSGLGISPTLVKHARDLVEGGGYLDSPGAAIDGALVFSRRLRDAVASEENAIAQGGRGTYSTEELKRKDARIEAYKRILTEMPSPEDMQELKRDLIAGKSGYPSAVQTGKNVIDSAKTVFSKLFGRENTPATPKMQDLGQRARDAQSTDEVKALAAELQKQPASVRTRVGPILAARTRELIAAGQGQVPLPRERPAAAGPRSDAGPTPNSQVRDRFGEMVPPTRPPAGPPGPSIERAQRSLPGRAPSFSPSGTTSNFDERFGSFPEGAPAMPEGRLPFAPEPKRKRKKGSPFYRGQR